jgi:hypothetical protein
MHPTHRAIVPAFVFATLAACAVPAADADVTLQEKVAVEGSGFMSLANMSGMTTTSISGRNSRIESDIRMDSKLARFIARNAGQTTEVVRLDDDVVLELEMRKKRFRQTTVSERRAQLEQASQQLKQAQAQQPMSAGPDESQCDWSPPTAKVRKPGAKEAIAGVSAQQAIVVVRQSCKHRTSGAVCDIVTTADQWLAPDFAGAGEVQKFRTAYAEQLGLATGGMGQQTQSLLGRYPASWSRLAEEMGKLKGVPVKMTFTLEMEGAGCQASSGQQAGGSPAPGAVAGQIAGMLFGRRKADAQNEGDGSGAAGTADAAAGTSSSAQLALRVTTELTAIDTAKLGAETFEAPPGFKKIGK